MSLSMSSRVALLGSAVALCLPVYAFGQARDKAVSPSTLEAHGNQASIALSKGWRFRFGDVPQQATQPGFDDSAWSPVEVPHTWNRFGEYGTKRSLDVDTSQGTGWYRLQFDAPPAPSGTRQYLDFAAVGEIADVWVNGRPVGTHKGAFSRFRLDVTEAWKPGGRNLVVVRADNSKPTVGGSTQFVIPLAGDFFVSGGMYRAVSLLQLPTASIDPLDHGGPGVYAHATAITASSAKVEVLTRVRNFGPARSLDVATVVRDAAGRTVATQQTRARLAKGASELTAKLDITEPHLWNGRTDPYLYTVTATLSDGSRVLDTVTQPLGLRTFRFDADSGFFLNGRHVKLRGVSRHQDWQGSGWAMTPAQHEADMATIAELGANTVRQAHYQHADEWTDASDRAGMVVWAELPFVTAASLTGGKGSPELWANAEEQMRELIRQGYNHPSIMMWSVGNEVDSAKGFGVGEAPPEPLALLRRLNALAKQEDPTRPTAFADCCEDLGIMKTGGEALAGTTDLIGYNRYYGWYYGKAAQAGELLGGQLDRFHQKHPATPLSVSEYGGGGAVSQHSDDVASGFANMIGRPHPEEYQAWVHEQNWPAIAARDFVFASWVWNMFDFPSNLRNEGDSVDLNDKGLVTFDRKQKKQAYWYYKVAWSQNPALILTGKRYVDRAYPVMSVKAYSTTKSATLSINGKAIGAAPCANFVCEWKAVPLAPGSNLARVTATSDGGAALEDSMTWNGPDVVKQGLRIDAGDLAGQTIGKRQFGSDTFVTGGTTMVLNMGSFGGQSAGPERLVEGADATLFDYWREGGSFSYDIPVPSGSWLVTLHLFEPNKVGGQPHFVSVVANGKAAVRDLDVAKEAGGPMKALTKTFRVRVKDRGLKLDFASAGGKVALGAIELTR